MSIARHHHVYKTHSVYGITWAFLGIEADKEISQSDQEIFRFFFMMIYDDHFLFWYQFFILSVQTMGKGRQNLDWGPTNCKLDKRKSRNIPNLITRNIMLVCISIGIAATSGFHLLVKERNDDVGEEGEESADNNEKKDHKMEDLPSYEMVLGMEVESPREVKFGL